MTKKNESLVPTSASIDPKELGPALIKQAQQEQLEATQKAVVRGVQAIMKDIQNKQQTIEQLKEQKAIQEKRLTALNKGEFTVEYNFQQQAPKLVFNDKELQNVATQEWL